MRRRAAAAPDAVERLVELYQRDRHDGESAVAFFTRTDLAVVKAELAELARLLPESASEDDFIDLAESAAFRPEMLDGECSA